MVEMQSLTEVVRSQEGLTEVSIEEIIDLIRNREQADIIYEELPFPSPNVITIVCGDKYCSDIREIKPIISSHSPAVLYIRSHDIDDIITTWKEYYVHSIKIYTSIKVDLNVGKINVEMKVDDSRRG